MYVACQTVRLTARLVRTTAAARDVSQERAMQALTSTPQQPAASVSLSYLYNRCPLTVLLVFCRLWTFKTITPHDNTAETCADQ